MTAFHGAEDAGLDHVTGLHVRSTFERRLSSLLAMHRVPPNAAVSSAGDSAEERSQLAPHPVVLVICDVVGLKQVNEAEGFHRGDAVLAAAAERFRQATASASLQARLGGDELVAIFVGPEAGREAALAVVQLIPPSSPNLRAAATRLTPDDTANGLIDRLYAAMRTS